MGKNIRIKVRKSSGKSNAKSQVYDGIKFQSGLEVYCYIQLKENKIWAEYEPKSFILIEAFVYNGEKVRPMTYKPDFVGKEFIIECKGWASMSWPLRWKIFKHMLYKNNIKYDLYLPRNRKDVNTVIDKILKKRDEEKNKTV